MTQLKESMTTAGLAVAASYLVVALLTVLA